MLVIDGLACIYTYVYVFYIVIGFGPAHPQCLAFV
jgi:hypothetical protein